MIRKVKVFFLLFLIYSPVYAQVVDIKGRVFDGLDSLPIDRATITLHSKIDKNIINFTFTDSKGFFQIKMDFLPTNSYLQVSMIGFNDKILEFNNKKNYYIFHLSQSFGKLREIKINSPPIITKKDTILYKVSSFSNAQDKFIGDVLKKMPGIEVKENGSIVYNGKSINKFYIEGLDLLDNKYGIAVNNIAVGDVEGIQILENHQPIKILEEKVYSDRAAINLKLKKTSKSKWIRTGDVESGASNLLWKLEGTGLRFGEKNQSINILKTNNTGQNIGKELATINIDDLQNDLNNKIEDQNKIHISTERPPIDERRSFFNESATASSNFLHGNKNGLQLRSNISLIDEKLETSNNSQTIYVLQDSLLKIIENKTVNTYNKKFEGNFNASVNKANYYLNNQLNLVSNFQTINASTQGTSPNIQSGKTPIYFVENDFKLIKNIRTEIINIGAFIHYSNLPNDLDISSLENITHQKIYLSQLFAHPYGSFSIPLFKSLFSLQTGIKYFKGSYNTDLNGNNISNYFFPSDSLRGVFRYTLSRPYITPSIEYKLKKIKISFSTPVISFLYNGVTNRDNIVHKEKGIYILPNLNFYYQFNSYWRVGMSTSYNVDWTMEQFPPSYFLVDYRNINIGLDKPLIRRDRLYSINLAYSNPIKEFFFYLNGSLRPTIENYTPNSSFIGYLNINRFSYMKNEKKNTYISSRFSKHFDNIKSTVSLAATYSINEGYIFRQNIYTENMNRIFSLLPQLDIMALKWVNVEYKGALVINKMMIPKLYYVQSLRQLNNSVNLGIIFNKLFNIKYTLDNYVNQIASNTFRSTTFSDIQIRFKPNKSKQFEYTTTITNIFNQKNYDYSVFDQASSNISSYKIRPLNILVGITFKW